MKKCPYNAENSKVMPRPSSVNKSVYYEIDINLLNYLKQTTQKTEQQITINHGL